MSGDEFAMSPEERAQQIVARRALPKIPVGVPGGITTRQATAAAKVTAQWMFAELAASHIDEVWACWQDLRKTNPKEALEIFMQLAEFTIPRLKAAQVNINANADVTPGAPLSSYTVEELEALASAAEQR